MLLAPDGTSDVVSGATLDEPEEVSVKNPIPGTWYVFAFGFSIPAGTDKIELRVTIDGKVVK